MGSEGRGEQILKTDQDNALLLRDGFAWPALEQVDRRASTPRLAEFGYPPCPGNIMLTQSAVAPAAGRLQGDAARLAATAPTPRA